MWMLCISVHSHKTFSHPPHHVEEGRQRGPPGPGPGGWSTKHRQLWECAQRELHPTKICKHYFTFSPIMLQYFSLLRRNHIDAENNSTFTQQPEPCCFAHPFTPHWLLWDVAVNLISTVAQYGVRCCISLGKSKMSSQSYCKKLSDHLPSHLSGLIIAKWRLLWCHVMEQDFTVEPHQKEINCTSRTKESG